MYYILEINKSIFDIYENKDGAIVRLFKLSNLSNCCLKEFKNGYVNGIYKIKNNKVIYISSNNTGIQKTEITDLPFEIQYNSSNTTEIINKNDATNISSEINVRMPPINTEIVITSDEDNKESKEEEKEEDIDLEELQKKIAELSRLKEEELNQLENLNKNLHEYENEIIKEKFTVDEEKNKLKRDKEKWEEFKNIFNADKKIYKIMKEQIQNNEIDVIPELFEHKFPVFKKLDEEDLLDKDSEIYDYIKLLPEDSAEYVSKNIQIKGLFNDNLVSSISLTEFKDNNYENTIDTDDES
jgi:hypothetical protein